MSYALMMAGVGVGFALGVAFVFWISSSAGPKF